MYMYNMYNSLHVLENNLPFMPGSVILATCNKDNKIRRLENKQKPVQKRLMHSSISRDI